MALDLCESRDTGPPKGIGVFATVPIKRGTVVWTEAADCDEARAQYTPEEIETWPDERKRRLGFFGVVLDNGNTCVDAYLRPWVDMERDTIPYEDAPDNGMFFNHSCAPNLVWADDKTLIAWRDIEVGAEMTYDYGTEDTVVSPFACGCGEATCRGKVGGEEWRELQHVYGRHFRDGPLSAIDAAAAEADAADVAKAVC